jgi:hypothetical protein
MGHMKFDNLVKIRPKQATRDMPNIVKPSSTISKKYQHGKHTRASFKSNGNSITKPLELIQSYLYGPTRT